MIDCRNANSYFVEANKTNGLCKSIKIEQITISKINEVGFKPCAD